MHIHIYIERERETCLYLCTDSGRTIPLQLFQNLHVPNRPITDCVGSEAHITRNGESGVGVSVNSMV